MTFNIIYVNFSARLDTQITPINTERDAMRIVVGGNDTLTGTFSWELPKCLQQRMSEVGKILRKKMKLSEANATEVEKAVYAEIQALMGGFLNIVSAIHFMDGDGGAIATELLFQLLSDFAKTTEVIARGSTRRAENKKHRQTHRKRR